MSELVFIAKNPAVYTASFAVSALLCARGIVFADNWIGMILSFAGTLFFGAALFGRLM